MNKIDKDQKIRLKAKKALDFLRNHPALNPEINGDSLFDGMWFFMAPCCKKGKTKGSVAIWRGQKGWEKYKNQFDKDYKDDTTTPQKRQSVRVPYEKFYGEKWEFDHVEYWYETTFFVFEGNPYSKTESWESKNWGRYGGPQGGANTFEEAIIDCAKNAKKIFGNFDSYYDFETNAEKKCHKNEKPFFFKPMPEEGLQEIIFNKKYVDISVGMKNLRWLKWFIKTDYAKKNWNCSIKAWKKRIERMEKNEPVARKKILSDY